VGCSGTRMRPTWSPGYSRALTPCRRPLLWSCGLSPQRMGIKPLQAQRAGVVTLRLAIGGQDIGVACGNLAHLVIGRISRIFVRAFGFRISLNNNRRQGLAVACAHAGHRRAKRGHDPNPGCLGRVIRVQ
jgi:hypothetical protein